MPAKEPAGGVKPTLKSVISTQSTSGKFISVPIRWFTWQLLAPTAAVFLLVILFVIGFSQGIIPLQRPETNNSKQVIPGSRILSYQEEAFKKNKSYQGYISLFQAVFPEYLQTSKQELRAQLENFSVSAKSDYPNEYKEYDFIVPCFDDGCKLIEPDSGIKEIIDTVSKFSTSDESTRVLALNKLRSLKYYDNVPIDIQLSAYNGAFQSILFLYNFQGKDASLRDSLQKLEKIIAEKFPENYQALKMVKYYDF